MSNTLKARETFYFPGVPFLTVIPGKLLRVRPAGLGPAKPGGSSRDSAGRANGETTEALGWRPARRPAEAPAGWGPGRRGARPRGGRCEGQCGHAPTRSRSSCGRAGDGGSHGLRSLEPAADTLLPQLRLLGGVLCSSRPLGHSGRGGSPRHPKAEPLEHRGAVRPGAPGPADSDGQRLASC